LASFFVGLLLVLASCFWVLGGLFLLLVSFARLIRQAEAAARELARLPIDPVELRQSVDTRETAAALKQADLGVVKPCSEAQLLLRDARPLAGARQVLAEALGATALN
jgi:hypothetical protein